MSKYFAVAVLFYLIYNISEVLIMNELIFTPIFKTKAHSEYNALKILEGILLQEKYVVPYIEAIKDFDNRNILKYISFFKDNGKAFIFEPISSDIEKLTNNNSLLPTNCILSMRITKTTEKPDVKVFIDKCRANNRVFGLKIDNSDDRFMDILLDLKKDELLFIELNGTSLSSSTFLDDLLDLKLACIIIIHSNERFQYLRGDDFNDDAFNNKNNFNTSIIDSIKEKEFKFIGFGSRCSAKDDNTEDIKRSNEVRGVFLIYCFKQNNFYSLISKEKNHISKVYTDFLPKLASHQFDLESKFFNYTPLSKVEFDKCTKKTKLTSNSLITVSIIRYIEEILNNL